MDLCRKILLLITFGIHLPLIAQFHPMLDEFTAFEYQGDVYLSWTIGRGNTCNGILVQRSDNNQFFNEIGDIPGICGSIETAQSYNWIDRTPLLNATNYYRLELGAEGPSESVNVEVIALSAQGYQVRPNPIKNDGVIYYRNDSGRPHTLNLYDISGRLIANYAAFGNYFEVDATSLNSGLYLFTIQNEDNSNAIAGKFAVSH
jgi:hypothetical protein